MNEIEKAIKGARAAQVSRIYGGFSNIKKVMADDSAIQKGEDIDENPFDAAAKEADMEKSDIMNALSYQSEIKVSKTGKEIKKQVDDVILPELTANLAVKENEATEKLKECGGAPTKDVDPWWTSDVKMDVGYKVYDWEETYFNPDKEDVAGSLSYSDAEEKKAKVNCPTSKEEADCRRCYNDIVRAICNIKVDIKACEILKELNDGTTYELSPRQVLSLKF